MNTGFFNRIPRGSAGLALMLSLAMPASAQETAPSIEGPAGGNAGAAALPPPAAPAMPRATEALPGVADIDFSLQGDSTEAEADSATVDPPAAYPNRSVETQREATQRSGTRLPAARQPAPSVGSDGPAQEIPQPATEATSLTTTSPALAHDPAAPTVQAAPEDSDAGGGVNLALMALFAAALLGGGAFLLLRPRRVRADGAIQAIIEESAVPVSRRSASEAKPMAAAEAVKPTPPPADLAPPIRDADPDLRTRIPSAAAAAASRPAAAPVDPKPPRGRIEIPRTSFVRYDKYGLPIPVQGARPATATAPSPKPNPKSNLGAVSRHRPGPVRYDVMGLPIFE